MLFPNDNRTGADCLSSVGKKKLDEAFGLIDAIVQSDIEHGFPSAQISVLKDGEMLFEKAWGTGVSSDTLFDLASNTKMYSAVYAIQYLASRSMLDIDSTVCQIMGNRFAEDVMPIDFGQAGPSSSIQREWKRSITVRDLLTHHAGMIPEGIFLYRKDFRFQGVEENPLFAGCDASLGARKRVWDSLCRMPLARAPGKAIEYSDIDFVLLCLIVEKVAGMRMDEFLSTVFLKPMKLRNIVYNPLLNGFSPDDCAPTELHGNTRDGLVYFDGIRTAEIRGCVHDEVAWYAMAGISGHAGLFANAHDLARFAGLMIHGEPYFTNEVLDRFTSAFDSEHDEWGLGWYRQGKKKRSGYFSDWAPENTVGHQGWTGTLTVIDRAAGLVMVVLTSKRHTALVQPADFSRRNQFEGNFYTTGQLGFVSRLVYDALHEREFDTTLDLLEQSLIAQEAENDCPASRAALQAFREARRAVAKSN